MIAEEMDTSLALLQNLTCWPVQAMTYLSLNQRKESSKNKLTPETVEILQKWLHPDYLLYNHFLSKFKERVSTNVVWLSEIVNKLKLENQKVHSDCVISHTDNNNGLKGAFRMWSSSSLGYKINGKNAWCKYYAISEMAYTNIIRQNHKDKKVWDR